MLKWSNKICQHSSIFIDSYFIHRIGTEPRGKIEDNKFTPGPGTYDSVKLSSA